MSIPPPQVLLRLGSHAEKEYFEKLAKSLDGMIFGGNLLEITPAATCSLIFSLVTKRGGKHLPFYIDPMTYCFGPYIDGETGRKRTDLKALKSEKLVKRGSSKTIVSVKESYMSLANELGDVFRKCVGDGQDCTAIDVVSATSSVRDEICEGVIHYQVNRLRAILEEEELLKSEFGDDAQPDAVFAPYFYIDSRDVTNGLRAAIDLARRTAKLAKKTDVHAIVCATSALLSSEEHINILTSELPKTGITGVWFWFDGFDEFRCGHDDLAAFRRLVSGLNGKLSVFNLHGGYFSLLLAHDGLTGISHGVGYGEQKQVGQVIGAAAPTVRYYLPPIRKRIGVPEIERSFPDVGIETAEDFYEQVCNCQICKGVIGDDLDRFKSFGQMHRANENSKKDTQTPAAAKMCRYHFLINRFKERKTVAGLEADERSQHVSEVSALWKDAPSLQSDLGRNGEPTYLECWEQVLE